MSLPTTDKFGNRVWVDEFNNVFIKLSKETKKRVVGIIHDDTRSLHTPRKLSHVFKKLNAYGFNYYILQKTKRFDTIELDDANGIYRIPVSVILDEGQFYHFGVQGYELQIFLPLDRIYQFRIKPRL